MSILISTERNQNAYKGLLISKFRLIKETKGTCIFIDLVSHLDTCTQGEQDHLDPQLYNQMCPRIASSLTLY